MRSVISDYNAAFREALDSVSQYVVETDAASVTQFRKHLARLIGVLRAAEETAGALDPQLAPSFRAEMRDYHNRTKRFLDALRAELAQTAEALNSVLQAVEDGGAGTEDRLKQELENLRSVRESNDLSDLKRRLGQSISAITRYLEQLRREKDAVIAQLKDEIRSLHTCAEQARRAAVVDPSTGFYRRDEFENVVRREVVGGREIGIVHIWLRNLHTLVAMHPPGVVDQALIELSRRLKLLVPAESVLARWRSDVICAIVPVPFVKRVSQEAANSIVGRYVCTDAGVAQDLYIQAVVTSTVSTARDDSDAFLQKVDRLAAAA